MSGVWQRFGQLKVSLILSTLFFIWLLWTESAHLYKQGLARAWEGNQSGYALLTAIRETARSDQPVAYWYGGHTFATLYFKKLGLYLNEYPNHSPIELVGALRAQNVRHVVENGQDERLPALIALLKQSGIIKSTTVYRSHIWTDNSFEEVPVHHLEW